MTIERKQQWRPAAAAALCLACVLAAQWTAAAPEIYSLKEVVVTATRIKTPVERLPVSAEVVSFRRIEASLGNSATDAVADLAGVFVQRTGDFGRSDVNIRGLGSNGRRITVLLNGHPVKMGLFGCTITHALPLNDVERIEVVRGPMSVLYGSDALGGVLNIVTARPLEGIDAEYRATYGTHSTTTHRLRHGASLGQVAYHVSLDRRASDGHLPNSSYNGNDVAGNISWDAGGTSVSVYAKYFDGYREEPALATDPAGTVSDVWNDYERGTVDLGVASRIGTAEAMLKAYDEFGEHRLSDGWHSRDHSRGLSAQVTGQAEERMQVNGGIEFRRQSGERLSQPEGSWHKDEFAVYAYTQSSVTPRITATAGLRLNHDEVSGQSLAPQLGLILEARPGLTFRLNAARGFRSPQLSELYLFPSSNTDLGAEKIWSYEAGLTGRITPWAIVNGTVFAMKGEDLIELVPQTAPPPMFKYENAGEIEFVGFESGLALEPTDAVGIRLACSYLDPGEHTRGRPGIKIDAALRLSVLDSEVAGNLQYVGEYYAEDHHRQRIDEYMTVDARISRRLVGGLATFMSVRNVFDEAYAVYTEIPGGSSGLYRMPGRRYQAGLAYTWESR